MTLPTNSNFDTKHALAYKTPLYLLHFEGESVDYCNHIPGSPDNTCKQYLESISGLTQNITPEEGRGSISGVKVKILDVDDDITTLLATDTYFFHRRKTTIKAGYLGMDEADLIPIFTGWVTGLDMSDDLLFYNFSITDPQKWMQRKVFRGAEDTPVTVSGNPVTILLKVLTSTGNAAETEDFAGSSTPTKFTFTDSADTYPTSRNDSLVRVTMNADPGYITFDNDDIAGANYRYITFKCRWYSGTPAATLQITYQINGGHTYDYTNYYKAVTLDITGAWATYTVDMYALTVGGSDWEDETIEGIQFKFIGSNGAAFDIDYVSLGNSRYDVYDSGNGLGIDIENIDIVGLEDARDKWYPGDSNYLQFTIVERSKTKDWIEREILKVLNCYPSVDGRGRYSIKPFRPPLAAIETTLTITDDHVIGLPKWSSNLAALVNEVEVHYDWNAGTEVYDTQVFFVDGTSVNNRGPGKKPIEIKTKGLHSTPSGSISGRAGDITAQRKTKIFGRYSAPPILVIPKTFFSRFLSEAGDIIDFTNPNVPDIESGTRGLTSKRMEVIKRGVDWKRGTVSFDLLDTGFDKTDNYAVISPRMIVLSGANGTTFTVAGPDAQRFSVGWVISVMDQGMRIKKAVTTITDISGGVITVTPTIGSTPAAGWICTFAAKSSCVAVQQLFWFLEASGAALIVP